MSQQYILTERKDRILTVRFNRPDKKNALTQAMYAELAQIFESVKDDKDIRVVLLAGQADCFVRFANEGRTGVGIAEDGHGRQCLLAARTKDPARNLAAVGDEHGVNRGHDHHIRNTP